MGNWSVIVPEATENRVLNPSGEVAGNFAALAGATVTRSATYAWRGIYSYRVETAADGDGITLTLQALANADHYASLMVRGTLPAAWQWSLDNATWTAPALIHARGSWSRYGLAFPAAQANGSTTLYVRQSGAGAGDFHLDGLQVEEKAYWTTECDGDQEGCLWEGLPHASISRRSGQSRAGGRVVDIDATYGIGTRRVTGVGMAPVTQILKPRALSPGATPEGSHVPEREFVLTFALTGYSLVSLHTLRQALQDLFKPDLVYPEQPVRLRYLAATGGTELEIAATYAGGLEGDLEPGTHESLAAKFLAAEDPFFRETGDSSAVLTVSDTIASAARALRRVDGAWLAMGTGLNGTVYCLDVGPDGKVYFGGSFTQAGGASAKRIAVWDPVTETWSSLGTGVNDGVIDGAVYAITVAPDNTVYVGGTFTFAGNNVANTAGIAKWTAAGGWQALGSGTVGAGGVRALTLGLDGMLYVGGGMTSCGGVANTAKFAGWTAAGGWVSLGGGANDDVYALATGPDGAIYAGGLFTTLGGVACAKVGKWKAAAASAMGSGMNFAVYDLVATPDGRVFAGGVFTTPYPYIAVWVNAHWEACGTGTDGQVKPSLYLGGLLYCGGSFTKAGGITPADQVAIWTGSAWAHLPADLAASSSAKFAARREAALYLALSTSGAATTATRQTVTNGGSTWTYPKLIVKRSGGTLCRLEYLRNETTGHTVWFNYELLDGETLTVDFAAQTALSDYFGSVIGRAVLPGGDFGRFGLQAGANDLSVFVCEAGGPTTTACLLWRARHWGLDGVAG